MGRKRIFNGKLVKLFTSKLKLPNGKIAYFEEVVHPQASLVVPLFKNRIVFIRQYRPVIGKYIWELPAGILKPGETPYACAKREITEETGYIVRNLEKIGKIYTSPGFCDEIIHIFKADCVSRGCAKKDIDELIKARLVKKKEAIELFRSGKIQDAKTIVALAFAGII